MRNYGRLSLGVARRARSEAESTSGLVQLNVSRQAVIKLFVQREVDQHFLAKRARKEA